MKKFLSVLTIPLTALAVLTGAIALPLLVRPTGRQEYALFEYLFYT